MALGAMINAGAQTTSNSGLSASSQAAIKAAKDKYNAAYASGDKAGMAAAHAEAEAVRNQYGYSGGSDGSQKIPTSSSSGSSSSSSSSSNKSSSSSSGSSSSSSGSGYTPLGSYNDAGLQGQAAYDAIQAAKDKYNAAYAAGDQAGMDAAHAEAERLRQQYGYSGGEDGSQNITGLVGGNLADQQQEIRQSESKVQSLYDQMLEAEKAAQQAAVEQSVNSLNAQKDQIYKAGEQGNAAAQQAYMQIIDPNGGLAESLAARGLLTSGLTESSQIAAGNTYQQALNSNQNTVTEQLAEIERAITNARLNGDIATAESLASYYDRVANMTQANVDRLIALNQWGSDYILQAAAQEADYTGRYNGLTTMQAQQLDFEKRRLERELAEGYITREQFDRQFEAQYQALLLENDASRLNNQYMQTQM